MYRGNVWELKEGVVNQNRDYWGKFIDMLFFMLQFEDENVFFM